MNSARFMETVWQDFRYGARSLRLNPAFTVVAVLSLALGIGANTAIFQLIDAVRMRTLPVRNPEELANVRIANRTWNSGNFTSRYSQLSNPLWEQIRDHQQGFSGIAAWGDERLNLASGGQARNADAIWVSGDFFSVLGVAPALGRVFTNADDQRGCGSPGVVISYSFWQSEFGGGAAVLGKKLLLEGHPFEVIGVTPASFYGVDVGHKFDVAVPICAEPILHAEDAHFNKSWHWWLAAIGRLKPGWTLAKATAQLQAISPAVVEATQPEVYDAEKKKKYMQYKLGAFAADSGFSDLRSDYSAPLWLLLAIAGLVLLIACANLANLMLARASAREREIAVRLALGASRWRLVRQLLAESMLLAVAGAVLAVLLARYLSQFLVSFISTQDTQLFVDLAPDWRMLAFTAGLAVLTCLLFGLTPALRATRTSPGTVMKATGRGMTASRERFGLRRVLVVSQVAMSLVLLVGAFLFVGTLRNLLTLDAGFRQTGILVTLIDLGRLKLPQGSREQFKRDLLERVRAIPGVEGAATASNVPLSGNWWNNTVVIGEEKKKTALLGRISPLYFKTMGTPLLAGRDFNDGDNLNSPPVAIVTEQFARWYFNGANPVGKTFRLDVYQGDPNPTYEIVGLVKDSKYTDLRDDFAPIAYFPENQAPKPDDYMQIVTRSQSSLVDLTAALRRTISGINPGISFDFVVFTTMIRDGLLRERLMATLSGFFGFLAGLLATIGLYGVISYMVTRRTNEIGIRMALGADRRNILKIIMGEAAALLIIGVGVGMVLAVLAAGTAKALLFGLQPSDPATLILAMAALAGVTLTASYLPAQRAARLDPMVALRDE